MNVAESAVVIAKLLSQGCKRESDLDSEVALYFSVRDGTKVVTFSIPQPLADGGYTIEHLNAIELLIQMYDLELLPLDCYAMM